MNKKQDKVKPKTQYIDMLKDWRKINPFYLIIAVIISWTLISSFVEERAPVTKEVSLNETFQLIQSSSVNKITLTGKEVTLELKDGSMAKTTKEDQISFYELLSLQNIDPNLVPGGIYEKQEIAWVEIITTLAIPILTIVFLIWIFRQMGRSSGGLFSLGKSKAKLFNRDENRIGFKDVAGANEIKDELVEVVDFLKKPEKYRKLGARIPKGVLLIGPSGVGKTLLARAIAGEADVPFYSVAGSEFMEMIVGVGSARVRDLFAVAKETAPSLIFIDEIDAIGRHRGGSMAMSNDEREQTLNQILVEMDGFDPRTNVIIIAATNRPDILDTALVRPGRFDRHIKIELPDINEREEIIGIHMRGKPFTKEVQINRIAKQTVGFSGADIENMLNEAAILAARREVTEIGVQDLTEASTKVKLGPGRKLLQTDEQRKIVAYHEAGHGLVSSAIPNSDPVTRISIVSRAMSLGHNQYLPLDDQHNHTKSKLLGVIASLLGGRAAEEVVFSEETVGASSDIERATAIARRMVTDFGMSDLGPINFVNDGSSRYVLDESDRPAGYSDEVARKIDNEVQKIIVTQYDKAKEIIVTYRETLDKIADALLSKETLEQDDFAEIVRDIKH